ncbi:MAG: RNA polymerase sigma-70 factor [Cyanobacteria bacterium J06642_12]
MVTQKAGGTANKSADQLEEFTHYRSLLFAIAYRMLGSVMDAEDMVQETFIRWQNSSDRDIKSVKSYLSTVVTRLCIDRLRSARVQREQYVGTWLPEPVVTDSSLASSASDPSAAAELADTLTMAVLVLLEHLSPVERAVFLLHEAFGYDYAEIGRIVDKSAVNCRQIGRRARQHLAARRPRYQASHQHQEQLTRQFLQACNYGDVPGLLDLLAKDISLWSDGGGKVAACLTPLHGEVKVARFLQAIYRRNQRLGRTYKAELVWVNGEPGILYKWDGHIETVVALTIADRRIQELYFVRNPDKLQRISK